jgi:DNA polymerase III epsilon subunit-like protein
MSLRFGIDVETGGFEPGRHALLAIGCLWSAESGKSRSLSVKVHRQEGTVVEPAAAAVNGWKGDRQWCDSGAVSMKYAVWQLLDFVTELQTRVRSERLVAVSHNAAHDRPFIEWALLNCGADSYPLERWHDHVGYHWRCSMQAMVSAMDARAILPGSASLDRLVGLSGQAQRSPVHDAADDARLALNGYEWLLAKINEPSLRQLPNVA